MEHENCDIHSILKERREAVEKSIKLIDFHEVEALRDSIFDDVTHPWLETFDRFLEENKGCTYYHAYTDDLVHVLYCRSKETGIWFIPGVGIGIIQPNALAALKGIVDSGKPSC